MRESKPRRRANPDVYRMAEGSQSPRRLNWEQLSVPTLASVMPEAEMREYHTYNSKDRLIGTCFHWEKDLQSCRGIAVLQTFSPAEVQITVCIAVPAEPEPGCKCGAAIPPFRPQPA